MSRNNSNNSNNKDNRVQNENGRNSKAGSRSGKAGSRNSKADSRSGKAGDGRGKVDNRSSKADAISRKAGAGNSKENHNNGKDFGRKYSNNNKNADSKITTGSKKGSAKLNTKKFDGGAGNGVGKSASRCLISKKCGGCQYIDKKYEEQLDIKYNYVSGLLKDFGKVEEIIGMDNPYNYRNKVTATFRHKKNGEIISGTYEEGTHNVLSVTDCFLEDRKAQDIISTIRNLVKSFKITIHNEDSGYGLLRHVLVRTARNTGQSMVVLVTASPVFPSKKNFAKALLDRHPEITTIVQNINDRATSMVLGARNQALYGRGYIEDVLCGKRFRLSPTSFYQVNPVQTEILYNKAMEFAGLSGEETVIDAYCGIGTIGMVASDGAKEVIGVELNNEAVRDAITNAKLNGCKNIDFYSNDAGKFMVNMAEQGKSVDVVFMDPPRSGSDTAFMSSVLKLAPKKIVYISCGPESLARDLKYLTKNGKYKVERMAAVDMFPWTEHVETVVLLSQRANDYINIDISLDEFETSSAEMKATYRKLY